jgi:transposase-like protein
MNCPVCQNEARKFGKDRYGNQRFQCLTCRKTFSDRPVNVLTVIAHYQTFRFRLDG